MKIGAHLREIAAYWVTFLVDKNMVHVDSKMRVGGLDDISFFRRVEKKGNFRNHGSRRSEVNRS